MNELTEAQYEANTLYPEVNQGNRTWKRIEAGLYESNDRVLVESAAHAGRSGGGWFITFPEEWIPGGWARTLREAKAEAGA